MKHKITIIHSESVIECDDGAILSDVLHENNISLPLLCGGKGKCGKCKVRIIGSKSGAVEHDFRMDTLSDYEIKKGIRLACQYRVHSDVSVKLIDEENSDKTVFLTDFAFDSNTLPFSPAHISPPIENYIIKPAQADVHQPLSDVDRVLNRIPDNENKKYQWTIDALRSLPKSIRTDGKNFISLLKYHSTVLSIKPVCKDNDFENSFGVAVDIGTTTIAAELVNMRDGSSLGAKAILNPQRKFGEDVISRIHYIMSDEAGLALLQKSVVDAISSLIDSLIAKHKIKPHEIHAICAAGNSTMTHILAGVTPQYMGLAPYLPVFSKIEPINANSIGFKIHPEALLFTLPNIGGFVGGDTISDLLTFNIFEKNKITLLVDIGTNGEIVASNGERAVAASAAAGPAFEGAKITMGMRGESGAIERFRILGDEIKIKTIFDEPARGICGSGLVDIVAELLKANIIDSMGRFITTGASGKLAVSQRLLSRLLDIENDRAFSLSDTKEGAARHIMLYGRDLRELQLAKAAIAAGIEMLLMRLGASVSDIDKICLAGAFGNYISKNSARRIGLLPASVDESKIFSIGNAALLGAKLFLLYEGAREYALDILPGRIEFIELAGNPDFQDIFADKMFY